MQIRRTRATEILGKALTLNEDCLLAILDREEDVHYAFDRQQLEDLLQAHPGAVLLHNQNEQALQVMELIDHPEGQKSLEVFQDTEGVLGLRAYKMVGKLQTPIILELRDE